MINKNKTMKNLYLKINLLLFSFFLFYSCEKEQDVSITRQVNNVEASISSNKYEGYVPGYDKQALESISCSDECRDSILAILENSFTKISLKSTEGKAGVFIANAGYTDRSTGIRYFETQNINIIMDCEDNNPASSKSGWTGASLVNGAKNVELVFFLTDISLFSPMRDYDYAILRLDANLPNGVSSFTRYFDNEDDDNNNKTIYDEGNMHLPTYINSYGPCTFEANTKLMFYYFPKNPNTSNTHLSDDVGISYGVLGSFGDYQGYIISDDEDKNNKNTMYAEMYNRTTGTYTRGSYGNISGLIEVGANTKLYICRND
jgi:hypothetical protein